MLCYETGWHDLQIRQDSGNFADCTVQFANWLANLPIGRLARLVDWTEHEHHVHIAYVSYSSDGYLAVSP